MLAERMGRVATSPTLKVAAEAEKLRRQGIDVVDFGAGEPDFPTPEHVKQAGRDAIDANFTKYTVNAGTADLRGAIAARYRHDYGIDITEAETIVSAGGKQALFNAMLAIFNPNDEVITHSPGWPTIVEQIKLAEAVPVLVHAQPEEGFAITAAPFIEAINSRTRGIVINSPCNPTGALMSEGELALLADEAAKRGIWILVDLCYEKLIYDPVAHNLPKILYDRMRDRTVLAGSASKAYAMTGWRCGWTIAPKPIAEACNTIQSHSTSNACSITQRAVLAALTGPQDCVTTMLDEYRRRRDITLALITEGGRIRCTSPSGAFYLFIDVGDLLTPGGIRTSGQLAQALLDEARVALTAGEAFDAPGFARISYATSEDRLREGVRRIHAFVAALDGGEVGASAR